MIAPDENSYRGNPGPNQVYAYTTTGDQEQLFKASEINFNSNKESNGATLDINLNDKHQVIDGFGAAITGSTAYNLLQMSESDRMDLLKKTFDPNTGMGYSYIRVSIGCSDFSLDDYTYCDKPGIENFDIHSTDKEQLIPILKTILTINPKIKILGSVWSPPLWMKVDDLIFLKPHNSFISGYLDPRLYQEYAEYFVCYIKSMSEYGITIDAITIQNEPLNKGNSASCFMGYKQQAEFIKKALGPLFVQNNISTKIIIYDHNYNYDGIITQKHYPIKIYEDPEANKYIDGAGYHAYGGENTEMDYIRERFPDKNLYFTEMSIGEWNYAFQSDLMWNIREIGIGTLNKGCKCAIMWNFLLDDKHGPYRPKGCDTCYGAIDVSKSDYKTLKYNSHYFDMAHLSKVIKADSTRVGATLSNAPNIYATSAVNLDGTIGAVILNDQDTETTVTVNDGTHSFNVALPKRSVVSVIWQK